MRFLAPALASCVSCLKHDAAHFCEQCFAPTEPDPCLGNIIIIIFLSFFLALSFSFPLCSVSLSLSLSCAWAVYVGSQCLSQKISKIPLSLPLFSFSVPPFFFSQTDLET